MIVGSVCVCVCPLRHISTLERLSVLKMLSRTQRATEVKIFVGFFSKTALLQRSSIPSFERPYIQSAIFLQKVHMRITSIYHVVDAKGSAQT